MKSKFCALSTSLFFLGLINAYGQTGGGTTTDGRNGNTITTAVPFLLITPDARAGAAGDAGVATSPDVNATYWNPAKLAFLKDEYGFALSYSPWLQKLV